MPVLMQAVKESFVSGACCRGAVQYHEVEALQAGAMKSKRFPHDALQAVAADRAATILAGNRQAEPRLLAAILFV